MLQAYTSILSEHNKIDVSHIPYFFVLDSNSDEIYAKDAYENEIYPPTTEPPIAKREGGISFYAKDSYKNEFVPYVPLENGYRQYLYYEDGDGNPVYPKKESGAEYYPNIIDGHEIVATSQSFKWRYARDQHGEEFYPKNKDKVEYVEGNRLIKKKDGSVLYPKDEKNIPKYPVHYPSKDEYYVFDPLNQKYTFLRNEAGHEYYAKDHEGGEILPPDKKFALTKNLKPLYRKDKHGLVIYPKHRDGHEFYFKTSTGSDIVHIHTKQVDRYARNSEGDEIYPQEVSALRKDTGTVYSYTEVILNNRYAKNRNGHFIYPLDELGNEFTIDPSTNNNPHQILPLGYPITNDRYIIVPENDGKPYIQEEINERISMKSLVGVLERLSGHRRDYITNVKSERSSRSFTKFKYETKPLPFINLRKNGPVTAAKPVPVNSEEKNVISQTRVMMIQVRNRKSFWYGWYYILAIIVVMATLPLAWYVSTLHGKMLTSNSESTS